MTDLTPKFDPIPRLQQIAATIRDSGADTFDAPATAAYYIECAIKEIERLRRDYSCICNEMRRMMEERDEARRELDDAREERDEARRLWCMAVEEIESGMTNETRYEVAETKGWDCFKEKP